VAAAQAQIEIAIKNVRALDNLSTKLNKLILVNKKLVTSINKLDTTFKNISKSGLGELERGSKKASKGVLTTTDSIKQLQGGIKGLQREVAAPLDLIGNRFKTIGKGITLQPIKGLVDELTKIPYVVKRGVQDWGTFFEILNKGKKDIVTTVAGLGALIANVKNLGVTTRTNLTNIGTLLDKNADKAENFLNRMVLGIKMQNTAFALAQNTALAQQKSLPGSLLRNTLRSQAGRAGTGFGDFSQGIGEYNPYQIASPTPRYGAGRIGPIHATQHSALQSNPYMGQFDNATQKSIARHTKRLAKISKHTDKIASLLANQQAMAGLSQYGAPIGPVPPTLGQRAGVMANNLGFGKNANPQGIFASRGGMGGRMRGGISSAMIGGMFPLLFGQGGASAAGGGLGGLAGGMLGGGFGFGLSLLGTVAGSKIQEIDDFNKSLTRLNATLSSSGDGFKTTGKDVSELAKRLGVTKQEAINVLNSFAQFDSSGVRQSLANVFGTDSGAVDQIASARTEASLVQTIFDKRQELGLEVTEQLIDQSKIVDNATLEFALVTATLKKKKEIAVEEAKRISIMERINAAVNPFHNDPFLAFGKENKGRAAKVAAGFDDSFDEDVQNIMKSMEDLRRVMDKVALASATDLAEALREVNIEITKLQNPTYQLIEAASAISGAFSESFKGIISGTMSVQQAFANMFQRIADHFLDMAAKMAANKLMLGILQAFVPGSLAADRAFSGLGPGSALNTPANLPMPKGAEGAYWSGGLKAFASGGMATRPTLGLVGEAGEDEYIIPASKMAASMQRYSAGARGESVIPGTGSSHVGAGGGASTTVNYSGPILNFNSEEFVPKSAVGQIIATATSQGARAGENKTLSTLRNSRSARSRLGM
jgi:hypothetical protein